MAYTRKKKVEKKPQDIPVVEEKKAMQEEQPSPEKRGLGMLSVKMACVDATNEWNFKAKNAPDAIEQGRVICAQNGYHFPSQVVVWEFS